MRIPFLEVMMLGRYRDGQLAVIKAVMTVWHRWQQKSLSGSLLLFCRSKLSKLLVMELFFRLQTRFLGLFFNKVGDTFTSIKIAISGVEWHTL